MHPHQYPASPGWPPDPHAPPPPYPPVGGPSDQSWPDDPFRSAQPQGAGGLAPGRPPSAVPLGIGVAGAGIAALAFLVSAALALLVFQNGTEKRGDSEIIAVTVLVEISVVAALVLIYSIGLVLGRRDAGRSGIVWIGAAVLPWTLVIATGITGIAREKREVLSEQVVTVATVVSFASAGLALLGLVVAMIFLGIPPGRRWLAERVLARTEPLWPPAPLIAARKRFTLSAVLGMGGSALQLILTPLLTKDGDGRGTFLTVMAVILVTLVAIPLVLAWSGSRLALNGRRGGAHLARAAGVFLVYGIQPFMLLGVLNGLAVVFQNEAATLPPAAGTLLAALATAAVMLGLVQFVAGLAALADPRSEVYLRSGGRRASSALPM